jgi:hypothetical protein
MLLLSCTNEGRAREVLLSQGFTNIELTGWAAWACSKSDDTCTGFIATGPTGRTVRGAVGCGYGGCSKGCTLRYQ